jgi:hypothetical protein
MKQFDFKMILLSELIFSPVFIYNMVSISKTTKRRVISSQSSINKRYVSVLDFYAFHVRRIFIGSFFRGTSFTTGSK